MVIGRTAGHPTGGRKPPSVLSRISKRQAPYEPKARPVGKVQAQNNKVAQRSRSRLSDLSPEEVQTLMDLDNTKEDLDKQMSTVLSERDSMKSSHRNDLDEGKRSIRCGKSNDAELQAVTTDNDHCIEQLNIAILGKVADDRHSWEELLENPEIKTRQDTIESALTEAEKLYEEQKVKTSIKVAAFEKAKKDYDHATETLRGYENSIKTSEGSMIELMSSRNQVTAERDQQRALYDNARQGEQTALSRKAEKDGEKQVANQQRERMLERVNKLSNNIKGLVVFNMTPEILSNMSVVIKGLDRKTLEVKHLKFDFDGIATSLSELPISEKKNVTLIIQGSSVEESTKVVGEWLSRSAGVSSFKAVEVYNDQSRDLLLPNEEQQQELISSGGSQDLGLSQLTSSNTPDLTTVYNNLALRSNRGIVTGRQSVAFYVVTQSQSYQVLCLAPASKEDPVHVLTALARLSTEPKESKSMLKRSMLGRQIHSSIIDGTALSVVINVDHKMQQNTRMFLIFCTDDKLGNLEKKERKKNSYRYLQSSPQMHAGRSRSVKIKMIICTLYRFFLFFFL